MGTITLAIIADGAQIVAADHRNNYSAIQNVVNGHIDDANVDPASNVATQKGKPLGLTGATATTRFVGATATGAPASGTFAVGDFVVDQTGKMWVCTGAGTPGTWIQVGSAGVTTYRKTTAKTVNTTTAATDLLNGEITIGAGVMGTTGVLRLTAEGDYLNNTGSILDGFRFQLVFGGTTLLDTGVCNAAQTVTASASRFGWGITAIIRNLGAANSQWAKIESTLPYVPNSVGVSAFTTGEGRYWTDTNGGWFEGGNTGAVDTSAAKLLELKVINGSASASCETKLYGALVEIL